MRRVSDYANYLPYCHVDNKKIISRSRIWYLRTIYRDGTMRRCIWRTWCVIIWLPCNRYCIRKLVINGKVNGSEGKRYGRCKGCEFSMIRWPDLNAAWLMKCFFGISCDNKTFVYLNIFCFIFYFVIINVNYMVLPHYKVVII